MGFLLSLLQAQVLLQHLPPQQHQEQTARLSGISPSAGHRTTGGEKKKMTIQHEEVVDKRAEKLGYYPHIIRCAVCGYPVADRMGIALVASVLGCLGLILITLSVITTFALALLLLVMLTLSLAVLGYITEMHQREFYRTQRKHFLKQLEQ